MKQGAPRTRAVTTAARSISMSAICAGLFGLLQPAFSALRAGMQVETRVFSAITCVHDMTQINTERADLVSQRGVVVTATP